MASARTPRKSRKRARTSRERPPALPAVSRGVVREAGRSGGAPGPIVGIGASAGGLEALKKFFAVMPAKTGLVFVVVVHLDPTHKSFMAELLAHVTGLTVEQAHDRQPLEVDHVYVIPPNRTLTIDQGVIRVHEVADRRGLRGSIDHFFRSLAEAEHERAIGIVLSGTGTEGSLGARAIKAEGGLMIAQTPETAAQASMPASAIATGAVDAVLAPEKMPGALLSYMRSTQANRSAGPLEMKPMEGLPAILALLRARTKYDFRGYKKGTLQRRIERRMGLQQVHGVNNYADYLRQHPEEVDRLFKDLLIGVTAFFRDPPAFEELGTRVFADLIRGRDTDAPIRVWVPGCSTGEEAYSIAIVLAEQLAAADSPCRAQIFATDIDEDALDIARAGSYPESIALDLRPQRLQRFFELQDHRYTIVKSVRESVVFAVQNLISDPPFSKLDLVSCRNVLIYLEPEMQEKLLSLFHFSLSPGAYLFLGSAEGVGPREELFTPISKGRRLFRRLGPVTHAPVEFSEAALGATAERLSAKSIPEVPVAALADQQLLEHYAPAAVVVRSGGEIVRFYGGLEPYMKLPRGEATLDVLTLVRDPLKPTLRAALHEAVRRNRSVTLEALDVRRARRPTMLRITVGPVKPSKMIEPLWLIIFEEVSPPRPRGGTARTAARGDSDLVRRLEAELRATKKEQQHLIEQLESGNEEMKAANEEVLSMNEELQSTNEELTTSKEELQSMNEELTTLNAQLHDKVHELTAVNDDLANLLVSTDIATVFLDTQLRIKRFTTAASHVLNLQAVDSGRPLSHIATNLNGVDLSGEARRVLESLVGVEREVSSRDGKQYFLRGLPYRTQDRQVQGVVLTLVDVTTLKEAERELSRTRAQMAGDLRRMTRLHELGERLAGPGEPRAMLEEILRAAIEITGAGMGHIQVYDEAGTLTIAAQIGFGQPFLDFYARVDARTDSACSRAMGSGRRVVVEDVRASPLFAAAESRGAMDAGGVQAVQSTPLADRGGHFLGMFSTHYAAPHSFTEAELRWLDLLARHAGDAIERQRTTDSEQRSRQELERRLATQEAGLAGQGDKS